MTIRISLVPAFVLAAVSLAALVLAACGGDDDDGHGMGGMGGMSGASDSQMMAGAPSGAILVRLSNWSVSPAQSSVPAGKITFRAVHDMQGMHTTGEGAIHELVVARKKTDGTWEVLGEAEKIGAGEHKDLTLQLTAGEYELQCNVIEEPNGKTVSHYANGMHTKFTVT